ncbi:universal stress protein [Massilia solisilvae]|uniref:Universal stress protein n=1 Tax=Massilia solisilvae TaxID=1811225 RepID=A0ABT2BHW2_9BURK|nr:universal stress protein [Massilia solisilvae]
MFKHILFPTDGSPASVVAAAHCVRFAADIGARLTILHSSAPLHLFSYEPIVVDEAYEEYRRSRDRLCAECLAPVEELARNAGIPFDSVTVEADEPYTAIITTANNKGCDLVAMASHGRKGIKGVLLGSQTQKVLTHSALPVLVFR